MSAKIDMEKVMQAVKRREAMQVDACDRIDYVKCPPVAGDACIWQGRGAEAPVGVGKRKIVRTTQGRKSSGFAKIQMGI